MKKARRRNGREPSGRDLDGCHDLPRAHQAGEITARLDDVRTSTVVCQRLGRGRTCDLMRHGCMRERGSRETTVTCHAPTSLGAGRPNYDAALARASARRTLMNACLVTPSVPLYAILTGDSMTDSGR